MGRSIVKKLKIPKSKVRPQDIPVTIPGARVVSETTDAVIVMINESDAPHIMHRYGATEQMDEGA